MPCVKSGVYTERIAFTNLKAGENSMTNYAAALAAQFHLKEQQTAKLIELIDAGNTIPFIARYRKEEHGSLDDQTIRTVYELSLIHI